MPYLTSALRGATGTGTGPGVGAPGPAHPLLASEDWHALTRTADPLHWVVLDVAGGPGDRPDPQCLDAVGRLTNAGVRVLGHLDLDRGRGDLPALLDQARRYRDWYRVGGFYLGRCPVDHSSLRAVRRTVSSVRALLEDPHVVLGQGCHPHPGYAGAADQLVTFTGPWCDYRWSQVAEWTADHPPERFCHLVHGVPRSHLDEALRIARWQGAGTIWFTDRTGRGGAADPWEGMPGYWDEFVSRIGTGVSE
ncbi:spherulation-specific family 4 protein [Streptomyces sp. NPDC059578]|uniref:spherulation-specific family 4 protein n=1 Tax=unclassified Streptomyces TaxID=2593676 RepID=UPI00365E3F28